MVVTILLFGLIVLAAVRTFWKMQSRGPRAETFLLFRCPRCGQKVRYLAAKAGRDALCPRCLQRWTLPTTPQQVVPPGRQGYAVKVGQRQIPPRSVA